MDVIFGVIGPSGAGKTTVAKMLESSGYNVIQSYTTRPPRVANEWGHTFTKIFVDTGDVVAYNNFDGKEYWATKAQYEGKGKTIYVIDPPGDKMLRETIDTPIVTIFLRVSGDALINRMVRDRGQQEACKRLQHDLEVFKCVKTDWVVDAGFSPEQVAKMVEEIIDTY